MYLDHKSNMVMCLKRHHPGLPHIYPYNKWSIIVSNRLRESKLACNTFGLTALNYTDWPTLWHNQLEHMLKKILYQSQYLSTVK